MNKIKLNYTVILCAFFFRCFVASGDISSSAILSHYQNEKLPQKSPELTRTYGDDKLEVPEPMRISEKMFQLTNRNK